MLGDYPFSTVLTIDDLVGSRADDTYRATLIHACAREFQHVWDTIQLPTIVFQVGLFKSGAFPFFLKKKKPFL